MKANNLGGEVISLEEAVIRKLKTVQHIFCSVESCTGGLISHLITNVPGASEVYWGSWISYDNSSKIDLGVNPSHLSEFGAVSPQVAQEMAECGLQKMQNSSSRPQSYSLIKPRGLIAIATTGIAGPSGGSREKPVGLCYIGLAISGRKTLVEKFQAPTADRAQTKTLFAQRALELVRGHI